MTYKSSAIRISAFVLASLLIFTGCNWLHCQQSKFIVASPDGATSVQIDIIADSCVKYSVFSGKEKVMDQSSLGIEMEDDDFTKELKLIQAHPQKRITESYQLMTGKRTDNTYEANEQTLTFINKNKRQLNIVFRVSNNGVAYCYQFPDTTQKVNKIVGEASSFKFIEGTIGWLSPMSVAKTGWCETNNSYEEHYSMAIKPGTPSPLGAGWVYPALFKYHDVWMLLSESNLDRHYCGTRLISGSDDNEYKIGFPDKREVFTNGNAFPESVMPWRTPWRIIAVGNLSEVMESSLGTDLASPAIDGDFTWVKPGIASWSWIIEKDESVNYNTSHDYIDYASQMGWEYCLIDADWDRRIGYEKIAELSTYAQSKNVKLILWYNSSGDWNSTVYSPKSALLTRDGRRAEFKRISEMGISGVKVDFFGGDGQSMIAYYHDIFEDAAQYGLTVNCHGATLPRGWHRTYPNLVSCEAVKGMEFITFSQVDADKAPSHMVMQVFTRNVFDPMDFTPMNLSGIPGINRVTSSAFELALPILFTSGIQHLAETPKGMATMPDFVKTFLQHLPTQWINTRFIDGYPGKYVVMARQAADGWYVAAINAENEAQEIELDLNFIPSQAEGQMITNGVELNNFIVKSVTTQLKTKLMPKGGFVIFYPN